MSNEERITRIQISKTHQELNQALHGFREHAIATHPGLALNYAFNLALDRNQYFHALCDIKRAARGVWGGGYKDVIGVLERAADKQFLLSDKESPRKVAS
jgi:hypothetical protein